MERGPRGAAAGGKAIASTSPVHARHPDPYITPGLRSSSPLFLHPRACLACLAKALVVLTGGSELSTDSLSPHPSPDRKGSPRR